MRLRGSALARTGLLVALGTSPFGIVLAEDSSCTAITSVPAVISSPGVYCLAGDISTAMTTGAAISIEANSVVLDLRGHRLGNLGASASGATAVRVGRSTASWPNLQNITIRNGTVRGFGSGVQIAALSGGGSAEDVIVEDVRFEATRGAVIVLRLTSGVIVRRCLLQMADQPDSAWSASAVEVSQSSAVRILENDIELPMTGSPGAGIRLHDTWSVLVEGNRIACRGTGEGTGVSVFMGGADVIGNRIVNACATGVLGSPAPPHHARTSFTYADNFVDAVVPYSTEFGIDLGGNR
jgi:hypothetical protein